MSETPSTPSSFPSRSVDLLLVHAPAFFDFREREDIYFPYLSTSGDVPITPLYEYFPVGFKTLQRYLEDRGFSSGDPEPLHRVDEVSRRSTSGQLLSSVDAKLIGIDLHWMVHVQGSLATAAAHQGNPPGYRRSSSAASRPPTTRTSSSAYPFVDMVMKGYDTHVPMAKLMTELKGARRLDAIENLTWKRDGVVVDNGLSHTPDTFSCGIDWSSVPKEKGAEILELLSTQNAGCAYNCGWCGGSREAFRRVFKRQKAMARKPLIEVEYEFEPGACPHGRRAVLLLLGRVLQRAARPDDPLPRPGGADPVARDQLRAVPPDARRHPAEHGRRQQTHLHHAVPRKPRHAGGHAGGPRRLHAGRDGRLGRAGARPSASRASTSGTSSACPNRTRRRCRARWNTASTCSASSRAAGSRRSSAR